MPSSFSGNLNEFHLGKLHPDRRFDCQIHNVAPFTHASSTVCTRLHFICFHSLMACCRHVRRISFLSLRFFPFLPPPPSPSSSPSRLFSSQFRWRKRAPVTLRPQSHLRQMKQPLACPPSLALSLSCPPFSSAPPSSLPLMTSLCGPWRTKRLATFSLAHTGGGSE